LPKQDNNQPVRKKNEGQAKTTIILIGGCQLPSGTAKKQKQPLICVAQLPSW